MNIITQMFINSIGGKCTDTSTIYINGEKFAKYPTQTAFEVFDDISGKTVDVVSDQTGEILKHKEA